MHAHPFELFKKILLKKKKKKKKEMHVTEVKYFNMRCNFNFVFKLCFLIRKVSQSSCNHMYVLYLEYKHIILNYYVLFHFDQNTQ